MPTRRSSPAHPQRQPANYHKLHRRGQFRGCYPIGDEPRCAARQRPELCDPGRTRPVLTGPICSHRKCLPRLE